MPSPVNGACDARFSKLRELLAGALDSDEELGACLCVSLHGETVVDIWGGWKDVEKTQPWERDTIGVVWSISKCVTNLAALICVDRGLLSPYERVAKYWPEYAANGKHEVQVRHFLGHTSGQPGWEEPSGPEELYDIAGATAKLAAQPPWWPPGSASGYHLASQGHLVGELVRRVSGKPLQDFIESEIAAPLGADFRLGVQAKDYPRVYQVVPPRGLPAAAIQLLDDQDSITARTVRGTPIKAEDSETKAFRDTHLGGVNGFSNARAVNRIMSAVTLGGAVDGTRLLSEKTLDMVWERQSEGIDKVLGVPLKFGIGFGLPDRDGPLPWIPDGRVCYWTGAGGHIAIMDCDRRLTICYSMNKMDSELLASPRTERYVRAIYEALGLAA